jgi:hypothetical protein
MIDQPKNWLLIVCLSWVVPETSLSRLEGVDIHVAEAHSSRRGYSDRPLASPCRVVFPFNRVVLPFEQWRLESAGTARQK